MTPAPERPDAQWACPQCGWTGDIGSEAHRAFIHPALAAAPVTDAGLPIAQAEGLLRILQQNARYEDAHERNVRAIAGFIVGLAPVTDAGLREAAQAVVDQAEADDDPDGLYLDYLVPATAISDLRAALSRQAEKETA